MRSRSSLIVLVLFGAVPLLGISALAQSPPDGIPEKLSPPEKLKIARALSEKLAPLPLRLKWDTFVLGGMGIRNVYLKEDLLLVESMSNLVVALDRHKGVVRWIYKVGFPLRFPPALNPALVFFTAKDIVHSVSRNGGVLRWKKILPFTPGSPPAANEDYLYLAALDIPRFYAFKAEAQVPKDGGTAKPHTALKTVPDWFFHAGDLIRAAPVERTKGNTSVVYLCSFDHNVYALDGFTGKVAWSYKTGQMICASPCVRKNLIFVGGLDHTLHALNRFGGPPPIWLFPTGGPVEKTPVADDDFVYVRAEHVLDEMGLPGDAILYAVDVKTGKEKWGFPRGMRMLVSGKDKTYILREGNVLVILEKETGKMAAEYPLPDFKFVLTNDADAILYLATDRGFLFALQE